MDFLTLLENYAADAIVSAVFVFIGFMFLKHFFVFLKNWWLDESQRKFAASIQYILLEIKFSKENEIFPKAMEQIFASFYQVYSFGIKPEKKWFEGQFEEKISLETVADREGIRFFIRVNKKSRPIIESAIFAEYPDTEIVEAEDYAGKIPSDLLNKGYDIMGADMILGKNSAYPIKTYPYFFGERKFEEQEVDPLAILAEVMSSLKNDERIWSQLLIRPAGDKLKEAAKKVISEKMGKKEQPKTSIFSGLAEFMWQLVQAPFKTPEWKSSSKSEDKPKTLSAADNELIRAVENKASKLAFDAIFRIIYLDKKETFSGAKFKAATSAFQQFGSNYNFMRPAALTMTIPVRFYMPFKKQILLNKKNQIFNNFINRDFIAYTNVETMYRKYLEPSLMNIEELATIFHPPIRKVKAGGLGQIESKKGAPPPNLPIKQ